MVAVSYTHLDVYKRQYFGWVTSTTDADYTYYSLEHSSQQGAAGNRSFIADPEVDKLIETGRTSADESDVYKRQVPYLWSQVKDRTWL